METIPDTGNTTQGKVDLGKRLGAALIDGVLVLVVTGIFFSIAGYRAMGLAILLGAAYFLFRDGLDVGFMPLRSLGKKFLGLRPVRLDGQAMTLETSLRRNWTLCLGPLFQGLSFLIGGWEGFFLFPMLAGLGALVALVEAILVLTDAEGRRFGDKFANTQVVASGD